MGKNKPKGYWLIKENCKKAAKKFKTRSFFSKKCSSAYNSAYKNKWLNEICSHMIEIIKPKGYWTKNNCKKEAKKYKTKKAFQAKSSGAYNSALNNGWLDDCYKHMVSLRKPNGYWTKRKCNKEAKKHKTRTDFFNKSRAAYCAAFKYKWLNSVCRHMIEIIKPKGYWTKNNCKKEAKKYKKRTEFGHKNKVAYEIALKNKWMDEICKHMKFVGNLMIRLVYVYKFSDNHVYVGLTHDIDERKYGHNEKGPVHNHLNETGIIPKLTYSEFMHVDKAKILEGKTVEKYRKEGYFILNKAKTGATGGNTIKWTFEACKKEAKKHTTKVSFMEKSKGAYNSARKNGWLGKIRKHMKVFSKPKNYWTKERCKKEAKKYKSRSEFSLNNKSAYGASSINKWLDEICKHMKTKSKPKGFWTKERCAKIAKKFKTRTEFRIKGKGSYGIACKNKWLDEICKHMKTKKTKPQNFWTKEACKKEAKKYTTKNPFRKKSRGAYSASKINGWFDEICSHMKKTKSKSQS